MLGIYITGFILISFIGLFVIGRNQADYEKHKEDYSMEPKEFIVPLLAVSLCWPAAVFLVLTFGPFVGLYYLGWRMKNKA